MVSNFSLNAIEKRYCLGRYLVRFVRSTIFSDLSVHFGIHHVWYSDLNEAPRGMDVQNNAQGLTVKTF